ncbi:hypothetical protein [uncultured Helicobacter sp.]|nr:hypothetical protein [uncultured Helicobacter sp.]
MRQAMIDWLDSMDMLQCKTAYNNAAQKYQTSSSAIILNATGKSKNYKGF